MNTFNGRRIGVERIASGIRSHGSERTLRMADGWRRRWSLFVVRRGCCLSKSEVQSGWNQSHK
jgi:hypothetical protein